MSLRQSSEIEFARQARRNLFLIRQKLLNPTAKALESCTPFLRAAIDAITRLQGQLENVGPRNRLELRAEVVALRQELKQIQALMQNACAFQTALAQLLKPHDDSICYAARGIVPDPPASTLRLEG